MEDIEDMTGHWPEHQVKFEDFKPVTILRNDDKPFQVKLTNGDVFDVAENQTILQVLRNNGLALRSSCESGTCGSCKTSYNSGEIDHRDLVLEDREKNKKNNDMRFSCKRGVRA
jgi:phthalate 4,5-dioxygenase reductase subunit